jgi:NADH-quinone oxidoreductase subunit L
MPVTHWTVLVGCIAIAGIPPFSGFFSKDEILMGAFVRNPVYYFLGVAGALMTAFYMFRLYTLTFLGSFRGSDKQASHLHESPAAMTIPLVALAVLSGVGGWVGIPEVFMHDAHRLEHFLAPVLSAGAEAEAGHGSLSHSFELMLMGGVLALTLLVIFIAVRRFSRYDKTEAPASGLGRVLENKWYVDEIYEAIVSKPLRALGGLLGNVVERGGIDGIVNGVGRGVQYAGRQLRLLQSGQVGSYILIMVASVILFLVIQLLRTT